MYLTSNTLLLCVESGTIFLCFSLFVPLFTRVVIIPFQPQASAVPLFLTPPDEMSRTENLFTGTSSRRLRSTVLYFHCRIAEAVNSYPHDASDDRSRLRWKVGLYYEVVSSFALLVSSVF